MKEENAKGKFIVIDGTDGSGKATQAAMLVECLEKLNIKVKKVDFPRYKDNFFGKFLRECLDGKHGNFLALDPKIASLVYAADRFESSAEIRTWIDEGFCVVADRYVSANQIHQGGKIADPAERKAFLEWLDMMEFGVYKIPRPDVIVYLHVPLEISLKLIAARAAETGAKADQAESDARHLAESQQSALAIVEGSNNWIRINCAPDGLMMSRKDIHQKLLGDLSRFLNFRFGMGERI